MLQSMRTAFLLLLFAIASWSQEAVHAGWNGVVRNRYGTVVARAVLRLQSEGVDLTTTTGQDGTYRFGSVPKGRYTLSVQSEARQLTSGVQIHLPSAQFAEIMLPEQGPLSITFLAQPSSG